MNITGARLRVLERIRMGPATNLELREIGGSRVAARVHELRQLLPWLTGETVLSKSHPPSKTCLYWLEIVGRPARVGLSATKRVLAARQKKGAAAARAELTPRVPVPRRAVRLRKRGRANR